jgi:hypothetical protein
MIIPGHIISYLDMCREEGVNLQRGMNFRLKGGNSIILMSIRPGAPYADRIEESGNILIYEGHDSPRTKECPDPKKFDQPYQNDKGSLTQNGLFLLAAKEYQKNHNNLEIVRVYEKIKSGIWVYNGIFKLVDAWIEKNNNRNVFKFRLEILENKEFIKINNINILPHNRIIPSSVKIEVWKRDKGRCVRCGSKDNLHFDHIIPFSKGGSSLIAENIQLLCARHNLGKKDKIE